MKLLSYQTRDGVARFGALAGGGVVDLSARVGTRYPDLLRLLQAGAIDEARRLAQAAPADHRLEEIAFDLPVTRPGKILCIGVNYAERNDEYRDGSSAPNYPSVFPRFASSFVGHGHPILRPPESPQLDYEGEIAIVIGRRGRRIAERDALGHVAGLTCLNEGTIRDWVRHGKFNVTQGKNWDASGSIGPWIATADEFDRYDALTVTTRVNGEVRQHDTTGRLMFPFAFLIHYVSTWTTLEPGDIISTGTPTGAGARFDPPRFLVPGDVVEVEASGVGTLRNVVADEVPR
ncbi:MAG TPA: fumarylacetoacetate hydrolase family protein [Burkholderiaceae bacterium]|nr:fumarylacetoacetate hydrolase family protein [Burkholderiaceae bacterium]